MKRTTLAVTVLLLSSVAASSTTVCLSKKEARQLWPKSHLFWYSQDHCWSNRRGKPHNLRYDLIKENHARAQAIDNTPQYRAPEQSIVVAEAVTENKQDLGTVSPWPPPATKPIRVIEIVQNSIPIPVTPVEVVEAPPLLPLLPAPPGKLGLIASLGGAFSGILFALVLFNRRISDRVKRSATWVYERIGQTGKQVSKACTIKRNQQSPVHRRSIREIIRRTERAGYVADLSKVLDRLENAGPVDEWHERDDSPIAVWARRLRATQDP